MATVLITCFWASLAVAAYAYVGYPIVLAVLTRLRGRPVLRGPHPASVSIVVAAYNEEKTIARRVAELSQMAARLDAPGEVIVVSDGSTDGTVAAARAVAAGNVRVLELTQNAGKASALNAGCEAARHDLIVFADARQTWAPDALERLRENFADPTVGGASGDLVLESAPGATGGVGMYWKYEKWLRRTESRLYSTVGLTGAIAAVRRPLYRPLPAGTLLDDVHWPLNVVLQGLRTVHDERPQAFDRLPEHPKDEFKRKIRTLSGNFQLCTRLPSLLVPWRNPVWFQFVSHKLLRLVVPWVLLTAFASSGLLAYFGSRFFAVAFAIQAAGYVLSVAGILRPSLARVRVISAAVSFLILNAAAWMAFWVWITGQAGGSWKKVAYRASD